MALDQIIKDIKFPKNWQFSRWMVTFNSIQWWEIPVNLRFSGFFNQRNWFLVRKLLRSNHQRHQIPPKICNSVDGWQLSTRSSNEKSQLNWGSRICFSNQGNWFSVRKLLRWRSKNRFEWNTIDDDLNRFCVNAALKRVINRRRPRSDPSAKKKLQPKVYLARRWRRQPQLHPHWGKCVCHFSSASWRATYSIDFRPPTEFGTTFAIS